MTKISSYQPQFNAGELSEWMAARTDFQKYPNGVETLLNFIPLPEGGAMRRSGSRFATEVKDSSAKSRINRFEFSVEQAYIFESGNKYFRFFKDQGQIVTAATVVQVQNGTFGSNISSWSDNSGASSSISWNASAYMALDGTSASDQAVAEQQVTVPAASRNVEHVLKFRVIGTPGNKVRLRVGLTSGAADIVDDVEFETGYHCHPFTPTNDVFLQFRVAENQTVGIDNVSFIQGAAVEIETPYATSELFDVEGPQSADVKYLFHKDHPTHKLTRGGHSKWSLIEVDWQNGPWLSENTTTAKTLQPGATTGNDITVTASGHSPFKSTDVGRLVRINNKASGTDFGWGIIVSVEAGHACTIDVRRDFQTTNASSSWQLGAWSETTGYPSSGAFYEQRLVAAGTSDQPQTFWLSQTADFENQQPDNNTGTTGDSDAFDYTISADDVNAVLWMSPGLDLVIGTTGGEWLPRPNGAILTPSDIDTKRHTKHGSKQVTPVRIGHVVLFLQRAGRKIREFAFHFEVDGFRAFDMTRLARHVLRGGVDEMDFAQEPWNLLWCVRSDGVMPALTYLRDEDVVGWGRHVLGGSFGTGSAVVESVAVIPGNLTTSSEDRDEVWMIVKRTINNQTTRYIEFFEDFYETGDNQADAFYVDSGITYQGSATDEIAGLTHLAGEEVSVWGDGAVQPKATVNLEGIVKLQDPVSTAQIGLGYTSTLKNLKLEGGAPTGTAVGKTKQYQGVTAVVLHAHTAKVGPDTANLTPFDFREVSDAMDAGVPFFSGEKFLDFDADFETDARIVFEVDDPVPFTLLAMAPEGVVEDTL